MKLNAGLHLAYSTNAHRCETWTETFELLKNRTLPVRERVSPDRPFGIGLRLSNRAAHALSERAALLEFQRWLGQNQCYVFTLNGFPYGQFRGQRVKEDVYQPDWTSPTRVAYTNLLFDLLAVLLPAGMEGSVTTLPCSFKGFYLHADELKTIRVNLWRCVEHVARVSEQTGRTMRLGLEPEPLCLLESSGETLQFFDRMRAEHPRDPRLTEHLAINYNTCHFAVEFEEPLNALPCLVNYGIRISKVQISSALKVSPTAAAREVLAPLVNDAYLRQVVVRRADGQRVIYTDLKQALAGEPAEKDAAGAREPAAADASSAPATEWRIHFHIPMHTAPAPAFRDTTDHILGVLDLLGMNPAVCPHLELETDTFEFLPAEAKDRQLAENLAGEYQWLLARLAERGLGPA